MRGWKISFVSFFNSYSFLCRHVAVLKVHSCGCNAWGRAFVGQRRIKGLKDTCALTSSLCATFSAFCDTSNASQIGASFLSRDHSLIASLFSSYFLFTPSFFLPTLLYLLALSFRAHIFFPFSGRNPRSFIYSPLKFSSNRSSAVRMSIKCHPCEMGSLHPFRGTRLRCNITWLHRARFVRWTDESAVKLTNEKSNEMKENQRKLNRRNKKNRVV